MSDAVEIAQRYLNQLAPHQRDREGAQIIEELLSALGEKAEAATVPSGYRLVPESALDWLFGCGGDFQCPKSLYYGDKEPRYWWRAVFRDLIDAPLPVNAGGQETSGGSAAAARNSRIGSNPVPPAPNNIAKDLDEAVMDVFASGRPVAHLDSAARRCTDHIARLEAELAEVRAKLAEAEKDAERLDLLDKWLVDKKARGFHWDTFLFHVNKSARTQIDAELAKGGGV